MYIKINEPEKLAKFYDKVKEEGGDRLFIDGEQLVIQHGGSEYRSDNFRLSGPFGRVIGSEEERVKQLCCADRQLLAAIGKERALVRCDEDGFLYISPKHAATEKDAGFIIFWATDAGAKLAFVNCLTEKIVSLTVSKSLSDKTCLIAKSLERGDKENGKINN